MAYSLNTTKTWSETYLALPSPARKRDPWEVFGLVPGAAREDIDAVYKAKPRRLHPDAGGDPAEFVALQEAYEDLKQRVTS